VPSGEWLPTFRRRSSIIKHHGVQQEQPLGLKCLTLEGESMVGNHPHDDTVSYAGFKAPTIEKLLLLIVLLMQNTSMVSFDRGSACKVDDVTA